MEEKKNEFEPNTGDLNNDLPKEVSEQPTPQEELVKAFQLRVRAALETGIEPKRLEGESYDDYKFRQYIIGYELKKYKIGIPLYGARVLVERTNKEGSEKGEQYWKSTAPYNIMEHGYLTAEREAKALKIKDRDARRKERRIEQAHQFSIGR